MKFLKRLFPKSMSGQLIVLILLTLTVSHTISSSIFIGERRDALEEATRGEVLARTATIARLISVSPTDLHSQILENAQSPFVVFSVTNESATDNVPQSPRELRVAARLIEMLNTEANQVHVRLGRKKKTFAGNGDDDGNGDPAREYKNDTDKYRNLDPRENGKRWRRHFKWGIQISLQLQDGTWLNSATRSPIRKNSWTLQPLLALALSIVLIVAAVLFSVRRITRPLAKLAQAADALGRGETTADIDEMGPEDSRRTIRAFNRMRTRLETFVEDRTNLIAAVSHDLRSPVTSLRLRAEFIEDEELRSEILQTLEEMQTLIETTLIFAREETRTEETRPTDLSALIESIANDFEDLGKSCRFEGPARLVLEGRPVSLKRAFRNLIENAVTYGGEANIRLRAGDPLSGSDHVITIDDKGPGIPESEVENIFQPFVRLEASRNRETGGIGLGLAIARSIIRGHGGEISAKNNEWGGLQITVRLPQADTI